MIERILFKVSGEALSPEALPHLDSFLTELQKISSKVQWAIVIGGGNFFRGSTHGKKLGITLPTAHNVGMLATVMNGLILTDLCTQKGLNVAHLSSFDCPSVGSYASQAAIQDALTKGQNIIFSGGMNAPFFSTDTTAIIRALQMGAQAVWKLTKVDGIYDADPLKNPTAKKYASLSYDQFLLQKLGIIDATAVTLARENNLPIRIVPLKHPNVVETAFTDPHFGSILGGV